MTKTLFKFYRWKISSFVESQHYTLVSCILMFMTFSFIGWFWEGIFHLFTEGDFVNRGILHGPWVPIYAAVPILITILLKKQVRHPIRAFVLSIVACTLAEYITSFTIEFLTGVRWWDYSEYTLNLNGRICLFTTLLFGICCVISIYFVAPVTNFLFNRMNTHVRGSICIVFLLVFLFDVVYSIVVTPNSGAGVTNYIVPPNCKSDILFFTRLIQRLYLHS